MSRTGIETIDLASDRGRRAANRLAGERIAWMTTVAADGTPQASPIWYLWDGADALMYSLDSPRVWNLQDRPRVALHLDGNGLGGDIVVIEGTASIDTTTPSAAENEAYLAKYRAVMNDYGWTPEWFASRYSVPVRIEITKYRYW